MQYYSSLRELLLVEATSQPHASLKLKAQNFNNFSIETIFARIAHLLYQAKTARVDAYIGHLHPIAGLWRLESPGRLL